MWEALVESTRQFLGTLGLPGGDLHELPSSTKRFPDGAQYRVEIPSVEGPEALDAVFAEADARGVLVHRVSQGSGGMLLTGAELAAMGEAAIGRWVEVSLFARPLAGWGTGAASRSAGLGALGVQARGADELVYVLEDIRRTVDAGIRGVLVTDLGVLQVADRMRAA